MAVQSSLANSNTAVPSDASQREVALALARRLTASQTLAVRGLALEVVGDVIKESIRQLGLAHSLVTLTVRGATVADGGLRIWVAPIRQSAWKARDDNWRQEASDSAAETSFPV